MVESRVRWNMELAVEKCSAWNGFELLLQMHTGPPCDKCAYVQMHYVQFDKYANSFCEHIYIYTLSR